ncbi:hypothetical protein MFLAVUS_009703 [Mucor flavus]|uniref:Uncharacterized protein n=1 Tax=Mucor flavus TaxID=439312 RepID=A0ABP9ZAQ6_9FUNG
MNNKKQRTGESSEVTSDSDTINASETKRKHKFAPHHYGDDELFDCEFVGIDIYAIIDPPSKPISELLSSETVRSSDDNDMIIKYDDSIDEDTEMTEAEAFDEADDVEMTEATNASSGSTYAKNPLFTSTVQGILTVREVMESAAFELGGMVVDREGLSSDDDEGSRQVIGVLEYHCVPITAEKASEWRDFDDLRSLVTGVDLSKAAIIMQISFLNCQVGLGKSTKGTIIATLLTQWMRPTVSLSPSNIAYPNYQIINSLLRVIKRGLENKGVVDYTLDLCSVCASNLRATIESARIQAEKEIEDDLTQFKRTVKRDITSLERLQPSVDLAVDMERTDNESPTKRSPFISGCAMPNKNAIKLILKAVFWTYLREEPVLYVNKDSPMC